MGDTITFPPKECSRSFRAEDRAADAASIQMLNKAAADCVETCFSRMDLQRNQCAFGKNGRLLPASATWDPAASRPRRPSGVCGADADTIVARNYLREVAGGTAAHSDHGRHLVLLLKKVAEGRGRRLRDQG